MGTRVPPGTHAIRLRKVRQRTGGYWWMPLHGRADPWLDASLCPSALVKYFAIPARESRICVYVSTRRPPPAILRNAYVLRAWNVRCSRITLAPPARSSRRRDLRRLPERVLFGTAQRLRRILDESQTRECVWIWIEYGDCS